MLQDNDEKEGTAKAELSSMKNAVSDPPRTLVAPEQYEFAGGAGASTWILKAPASLKVLPDTKK
jgi:hypothetical protein